MSHSWEPRIDYDTAAYWEGCARKELVVARCDDCRSWIHPPRGICPDCWSSNIGRYPVSGRGMVYTFTRTPLARAGRSRDAGGDFVATVWVEIEEQVGLFVVGEYQGDTERLEIGARVSLCWLERGRTFIPAFKPTGTDA